MTTLFSQQAAAYARYRPRYPAALFQWLASVAPGREQAWDCGTGNGQAALGLTAHFAEVTATDASAGQLAHAFPHPRVRYLVAHAETPPLPTASVDLVTVAQAVHWFDLPRFYAEVKRVLRPGGALAVWTYPLPSLTPALDEAIRACYYDEMGAYWAPNVIGLVDEAYRTLPFPFQEIPAPPFHSEGTWTLDDAVGFLRSWSAVQTFRQREGHDPIPDMADRLAAAWGDPTASHPVRWPLFLRVGRL